MKPGWLLQRKPGDGSHRRRNGLGLQPLDLITLSLQRLPLASHHLRARPLSTCARVQAGGRRCQQTGLRRRSITELSRLRAAFSELHIDMLNKRLRRGAWWVSFGVLIGGILLGAAARFLGYKQ
jgi:hypothetical protein